MKPIYLLLTVLVMSAVSCRTKEGAPGPAGATTLNKQGFVSGTITYPLNDGTSNTATVPFKYEYYGSLNDNRFYFDNSEGDYYEVFFKRRDVKDINNYFNLQMYGYGSNGVEEDPSYDYLQFNFLTLINNELLSFGASGGVISNITLDPATGRLTFDYTNDSVSFDNGIASVTVKVDVILNRSANYILSL